jgi:hypothetical protein
MGELVIDVGPTPLGVYDVELRCDASVLSIGEVTGGATPEFGATPMHVVSDCHARVFALQTARVDGPTGLVSVAHVALHVDPAARAGALSDLHLFGPSLFGTDGSRIEAVAESRRVIVGGCQGDDVCDDIDACNGAEVCDRMRCQCRPGTPLACDDGNPCNGVETCVPAAGCVPGMPLVCDDGNLCNGPESCTPSTGCVNGSPLECVDDGDRCTVEGCDAHSGCVRRQLLPVTPHGVTCTIGNMRAILGEPPQPVCPRRCPRALALRLDTIERLIETGADAPAIGTCRGKLRAAARRTTKLARRLGGLEGRVAPPDRSSRLRAEAMRLRERARHLGRTYCNVR